jgi:hypothetical protein
MSLLGRVAFAVGGYLIDRQKIQDELNLENVKQQMLFNRELALKQVDSQIADKASARDFNEAVDLAHVTGAENRTTAVTSAVLSAKKDEASDARDLSKAIVLKGIDLNNSKELEGVKHTYKLDEDQAQSLVTMQKELAIAGITADHYAVNTDGRMTAFNKLGGVLKVSQPGQFPLPPKQETLGDLLGEGDTSQGSSGSQARTAAAPTPKLAAPPKPANSLLTQLASAPPPPDGQVGRTMTGPNGATAKWNGKTWVLVSPGAQ